jgi:hypothetical protein
VCKLQWSGELLAVLRSGLFMPGIFIKAGVACAG